MEELSGIQHYLHIYLSTYLLIYISTYLHIYTSSRNISQPVREYLVATHEAETDPEKSEAVTCLAFEPTMPSKVASVITAAST